MDQSDLLDSFISLLTEHQIQYCVIGGQAVNAYAEPLVSLDLDIVISAKDIYRVELLCRQRFIVEQFAHAINVSLAGSNLRVQIQTGAVPDFPRICKPAERAWFESSSRSR